jgi:hypothetical protein
MTFVLFTVIVCLFAPCRHHQWGRSDAGACSSRDSAGGRPICALLRFLIFFPLLVTCICHKSHPTAPPTNSPPALSLPSPPPPKHDLPSPAGITSGDAVMLELAAAEMAQAAALFVARHAPPLYNSPQKKPKLPKTTQTPLPPNTHPAPPPSHVHPPPLMLQASPVGTQ